jgi:hypothetical protein
VEESGPAWCSGVRHEKEFSATVASWPNFRSNNSKRVLKKCKLKMKLQESYGGKPSALLQVLSFLKEFTREKMKK